MPDVLIGQLVIFFSLHVFYILTIFSICLIDVLRDWQEGTKRKTGQATHFASFGPLVSFYYYYLCLLYLLIIYLISIGIIEAIKLCRGYR